LWCKSKAGQVLQSPGLRGFWLVPNACPQTPMHIAFAAETRAQVRAFHRAALLAGGTKTRPPGLREMYHPDDSGAFVIGPDGHDIGAVCHTDET
jgi:hypothetical protein